MSDVKHSKSIPGRHRSFNYRGFPLIEFEPTRQMIVDSIGTEFTPPEREYAFYGGQVGNEKRICKEIDYLIDQLRIPPPPHISHLGVGA